MTRSLWLGLCILAGSIVAKAQVQPRLQGTTPSLRPLTAQEGKTIVNATWERDQQAGRKPDCSHLVHEVYAIAGYPYPYASSFDLYAGAENFVRVANPQPGDLIVWRGHAGIVINPAEHSFYSSVRSGLRTELYDAPNWRALGPARFYRYATAKPASLVLAGERPGKAPKEQMPADTELVTEDSRESLPDSAHTATRAYGSEDSTVIVPNSRASGAAFQIPGSILVTATGDKPSQLEIASAISELNSAAGDILREQDFSQLRRRVTIYDDVKLDGAKFRGKHGSVQVRIESRVSLVAQRMEQMQHEESLRWSLVRTSAGWEVIADPKNLCIPRDVAIRMLAARLALLTQDSDVSNHGSLREQTQIVRALSALLN